MDNVHIPRNRQVFVNVKMDRFLYVDVEATDEEQPKTAVQWNCLALCFWDLEIQFLCEQDKPKEI
jgi:hypothetical protein